MARTLLALAALLIGQATAWPIASEFLAVDHCLDAGGSYDYDARRCDFNGSHPGMAILERHGISLVLGGALSVIGCVLLLRRRKR